MKIPKWFFDSGLKSVGYPTIDHIVAVKGEKNVKVESRPYHIMQEQIEQILEICKINNIKFLIHGHTDYENKDTCTLVFWKEVVK